MLAATAVIARISYTLKNGRFGPSDAVAAAAPFVALIRPNFFDLFSYSFSLATSLAD